METGLGRELLSAYVEAENVVFRREGGLLGPGVLGHGGAMHVADELLAPGIGEAARVLEIARDIADAGDGVEPLSGQRGALAFLDAGVGRVEHLLKHVGLAADFELQLPVVAIHRRPIFGGKLQLVADHL